MSNYPIANQPESRRCENCGAPIMGRFSPCVVCHSLALEGPAAYGPRQGSQQQARAKLPGRRFWHSSPDTLVYPYDSIDEAELAAQAKRRARSRIVVGASVLAVSSAVYLVCMHADDWRGALSAITTHDVSARNDKPAVMAAAAGGDREAGGQSRTSSDAQQEQAGLGQHAASASPDSARVAAAGPTSAEQKPHVDVRPGVTSPQQPAVVAQNVPTIRPAPVAPSAALPSEQHQVASASLDSARVAAAPTSAEQKPHVDARPGVTSQQHPAVVAQSVPSIAPAPVAPQAALPSDHRPIVPAPADPARVAAAQPTRVKEESHVDARSSTTATQQQQHPAVVAQSAPTVRPAPITAPAELPREQHQVASAAADTRRFAAAQPSSVEQEPHVDARLSTTAQQRPALVAQNLAPVRPAVAKPTIAPAAAPSAQRHIALATPDPARATAPQAISAEDKQRADAARYLIAARASMKANNLSAAKSHVAAAIAAQPANREARRLRATIHTLEQQRDALLSLARSCGYIGHLTCTSRDASIALQIDSSSKAARSLATRALRESELRIDPQTEAVNGPLPAMRYVSSHH